jgi:hypothetical protein
VGEIPRRTQDIDTKPEGLVPIFSSLLTGKLVVSALALGTVAVGGTAATTAAIAGTLPAPAQQAAHELIGAPAAVSQKAEELITHRSAGVSGSASTSDADATAAASGTATPGSIPEVGANATAGTSLDAKSLCSAFVSGGLGTSTAAQHSLSVAADGDVNITAFCDRTLGLPVSASATATGTGSATGSGSIPGTPALPSVPSVPAVPGVPSTVPDLSQTLQVPTAK